jgi:hypothetical protein
VLPQSTADRGYFSSEEILKCEQAGITVTLPKPMTSNAKAEGRFGKQDLRYVAVKFIDEGINNLNRVVLINPVVEIVRKQRALRPIRTLNEALHPTLRRN